MLERIAEAALVLLILSVFVGAYTGILVITAKHGEVDTSHDSDGDTDRDTD